AKGEINLQNQPELGANSPREVNFYTVFSQPDAQNDPTPAVGSAPPLSVSRSAGSVTISWPAAVTGFTLESSGSLPATNWTPVSVGAGNSVTVNFGAGNKFYRLRQ